MSCIYNHNKNNCTCNISFIYEKKIAESLNYFNVVDPQWEQVKVDCQSPIENKENSTYYRIDFILKIQDKEFFIKVDGDEHTPDFYNQTTIRDRKKDSIINNTSNKIIYRITNNEILNKSQPQLFKHIFNLISQHITFKNNNIINSFNINNIKYNNMDSIILHIYDHRIKESSINNLLFNFDKDISVISFQTNNMINIITICENDQILLDIIQFIKLLNSSVKVYGFNIHSNKNCNFFDEIKDFLNISKSDFFDLYKQLFHFISNKLENSLTKNRSTDSSPNLETTTSTTTTTSYPTIPISNKREFQEDSDEELLVKMKRRHTSKNNF